MILYLQLGFPLPWTARLGLLLRGNRVIHDQFFVDAHTIVIEGLEPFNLLDRKLVYEFILTLTISTGPEYIVTHIQKDVFRCSEK